MAQVLPWEAFWEVGGMDPRFRGWGGEDVSFMRAVDTMWGKHKSTDNDVLHLWHPKIPGRYQLTRQWQGQPRPEMNNLLAGRYHEATGNLEKMRALLEEL